MDKQIIHIMSENASLRHSLGHFWNLRNTLCGKKVSIYKKDAEYCVSVPLLSYEYRNIRMYVTCEKCIDLFTLTSLSSLDI